STGSVDAAGSPGSTATADRGTQTVSSRSKGLRTPRYAESSLRATANTRSPGANAATCAPPGQSRPLVVCEMALPRWGATPAARGAPNAPDAPRAAPAIASTRPAPTHGSQA